MEWCGLFWHAIVASTSVFCFWQRDTGKSFCHAVVAGIFAFDGKTGKPWFRRRARALAVRE